MRKMEIIFMTVLIIIGTCSLLVNINNKVIAQEPETITPIWESYFDGNARGITAYNGYIYVIGDTEDIFLLKYDTDSTLIWEKYWNGSAWNSAEDVMIYNGFIYIVGCTGNNGVVESRDAFLLKYDTDGTLIWEKYWGGDEWDSANGITVENGYIYVAGRTESFGSGDADTVLLKYDTDGALIWEDYWGGSDSDVAEDVTAYNGNIYVVGWTYSYGIGSRDAFILKYDPDGSLPQTGMWGLFGETNWDVASGVTAYEGYIYSVGYTGGENFESRDAFLLKYDTNCSNIWHETWGGSDYDSAWGVTAYNGHVYVTGHTDSYGSGSSDAFLLKYDVDSTTIYRKTWGGSDYDSGSAIFIYDGYGYLSGTTDGYDGGYLLKINPNTSPTGYFNVNPSSGDTNTLFQFDGSGSSDPEDSISDLEVRWDWENDGTWDTSFSTTKTASHRFNSPGIYTVRLEVRDMGDQTGYYTRQIDVKEELKANFISEYLWLILIMIIIILMVVIIVLFTKRKKRVMGGQPPGVQQRRYSQPPAKTQQVTDTNIKDVSLLVRQLQDMRNQGLITEEEFQARRKKLLDKI